MNDLAYPRLPSGAALLRLHEMRTTAAEDPSRLKELVAFDHPTAQPVPTGATIATVDRIKEVRARVLASLDRWMDGGEVPRVEATQFDITLGKSLHDALSIMPSDAGHEETWSFLATVVFPDVVWARFPTLHQDRALGKPRNVLRRAWHRHDVIGDLQAAAARPLGEDELTGIFERTAVSSNRRLARAMASAILASTESNRSEFARRMAKQVTTMTGPLLLDVLADSELQELVSASAEGKPWPRVTTLPEVEEGDTATPGPTVTDSSPDTLEAVAPPRAKATGDLVRQFHRDMVSIAVEGKKVLGYPPTVLVNMIDELGGVEAARRIVGSERASTAFVLLWEQDRLDLSVENLVLDPTYEGLFGPEIVDLVASRLRDHGAVPPRR